jgi:hypothetical protein
MAARTGGPDRVGQDPRPGRARRLVGAAVISSVVEDQASWSPAPTADVGSAPSPPRTDPGPGLTVDPIGGEEALITGEFLHHAVPLAEPDEAETEADGERQAAPSDMSRLPTRAAAP